MVDEKNSAYLLFLMQSLKIEESFVREGPDFFFDKDSEIFISKNSKKSMMWIGNNRKILSLQKRQHIDVRMFLKDLLKNNTCLIKTDYQYLLEQTSGITIFLKNCNDAPIAVLQ